MTKHLISPYMLTDWECADEMLRPDEIENWQFIGAALSIQGKQLVGSSQTTADYI